MMGFALALSGGGLLGAAHIGVLQALEEEGLRPQAMAGTSAGGLVGALYALGVSMQRLQEVGALVTAAPADYFHFNDQLLSEFWPWDSSPATGLINPSRFLSSLLDLAPAAVTTADFKMPTVITAMDVVNLESVAFSNFPGVAPMRGHWTVYQNAPLDLALGATMALPGLFDAPRWGNRVLIDGGTADTLPADWAAALYPGPVVAVNVAVPPVLHADKVGIEEILSRAEQYATQTLSQLRMWGKRVFVIAPQTQNVPFFGFKDYDMLVDRGFLAAKQAMSQLKKFIAEESG